MYLPLALGGQVNGVEYLSPAGAELACREQLHSKDVVIGVPVRRTLGFMRPDVEHGDPRPLTAVGHSGGGGSLGFADPVRRMAMGYVMNQMVIGVDARATELCRTVYACLAAQPGK